MEDPQATYLADTYRFAWPHLGIDLTLERLTQSADSSVNAEVSIRTSAPPAPGLLARNRLNLLADSTRKQMAKSLEDRVPDVDWYGVLLKACDLSITRWREGNPVIRLLDTPPREGNRWFLRPYVERNMPTVIFTYGGAGKSLIAAGLAVSIVTGRNILGAEPMDSGAVLYLDWEADEWSHAERVRAICAGADIDPALVLPYLHYRREYAPLPDSAEILRRKVVECGLKAIIIDSVSAARGGETKDEEATSAMFATLRSLNITPILIDHLPKDPRADKTNPIGTVLTTNRARNLWRIDKAQEENLDYLDLCLVHTKTNNGKYQPKRGLKISFESGDDDQLLVVRFTPTSLMDMPAFVNRAPLWQRIVAILQANRNVPLPVAEILTCLEAEAYKPLPSAARARAELHYYTKWFVSVGGGGGRLVRWAIVTAPGVSC